MDDLPPDTKDLTFGNSVYKIRFENRAGRPIFGHRYHFFLRDAVEDVPEYVVHWDVLARFALALFNNTHITHPFLALRPNTHYIRYTKESSTRYSQNIRAMKNLAP